MSKVVAITGVSGYLGGRLLKRLEQDPSVSKVIGIDVRQPLGKFSKLLFYKLDINAPLDQILKIHDASVMIHLVFIVDPMHNEALMYRINIEGTRNVLEACEKAGVRRILMASSATAYGAHSDNSDFLKESDRLRGNADFQYSRDKVLMEGLCNDYQKRHPECEIILFRPAIIMGPHVNNFISRYMIKTFVFGVWGDDPYMQFVHEDDIAEIFYRFIASGKPGAYNIGAHGKLRFSEIARQFRRRVIWLPKWLIYPVTALAWRLRLRFLSEAPASLLNFLRHPWVVDPSKGEKELGFVYRYTTEDAIGGYIKALSCIESSNKL